MGNPSCSRATGKIGLGEASRARDGGADEASLTFSVSPSPVRFAFLLFTLQSHLTGHARGQKSGEEGVEMLLEFMIESLLPSGYHGIREVFQHFPRVLKVNAGIRDGDTVLETCFALLGDLLCPLP